jgi:hypothetical protein
MKFFIRSIKKHLTQSINREPEKHTYATVLWRWRYDHH